MRLEKQLEEDAEDLDRHANELVLRVAEILKEGDRVITLVCRKTI